MPGWIRAFILFLLAGSAGWAQTVSEWKPFTSEPGRFAVRMPGTPTESAEPGKYADTPKSHIFTLTVRHDAYLISYADFSAEQTAQSTRTKLLSGARDGAIANIKGKLLTEAHIRVDGYPGRDVLASLPLGGERGTARFRIVLANNRLYMVIFVGPGRSARRPSVDAFLQSFHILPVKQEVVWETLASNEGAFAVSMPGHPIEDTADLKSGGKIYRFTLDTGAHEYIVSYNAIPGGPPAASQVASLLNKGRESLVGSLKGKILEDKAISLAGNAGKEVHVAIPKGAGVAFVRAFIVGDRYYQVMWIGVKKDQSGAGVERFLDSFRLVATARPGEWANFASAGGRFTVDLPGTPVKETLPNATTKFQARFKGTFFIVVTTDIQDAVADPEKVAAVLDGAKEAEVKALEGKVSSEKRVTLGDLSGLQVNFSIPESKMDGGGLGIERFYLAGKRLYEVAVITGDANAVESAFARFFDSFKITP